MTLGPGKNDGTISGMQPEPVLAKWTQKGNT